MSSTTIPGATPALPWRNHVLALDAALRGSRRYLWMAIIALLLVMPFQGHRGLFGTDEGRYSAIALHMLDSGDWLVPHRHPEHAHLSKPPLSYWTLAASMAVFGKNEWALRLPIALSFVAIMLVLMRFGQRVCPDRPWLPGLIYATSAMTFVGNQTIGPNNLLSAFMALSMLGWVELSLAPTAAKARSWRWVAATALGLAFLTKGPPAALPLLAVLVLRWRNPEWRKWPLWTISSASWAATLGLSWFVVLVLRDASLLGYFLGHEFVDRIASDVHQRNAEWYGPLVAYAPVLLIGALPWNFFLLRRASWVLRPPRDDMDRLLLYWIALPLLVFILARSRLPVYLLPLFVPASLWLARRLQWLPSKPWFGASVLIWWCALLALKLAFGYLPNDNNSRQFAQRLSQDWESAPSEIVFLNEPAMYGLRLYLDVPIRRVGLSDRNNPAVDQPVSAELFADHERLWMSKCSKESRNLQEIADHGGELQRVSKIGRFCSYKVSVPESMFAAKASETPSPTSPADLGLRAN